MENDKLKFFIRTLLEFGLIALIFFLIGIFATECVADASLGLINFGETWLSFGATSDSSYITDNSEWSFNNITDEKVRLYFPNVGDVVTDYQPYLTFNKFIDYRVSYSVGNPLTGQDEYVTYNGSGYSIRPIRDVDSLFGDTRYIYDMEVELFNDPNVYNDEIFGTWDLPQFMSNTSAFHGVDYGYFDIEGEITTPDNSFYYSFHEMRYYYDPSADFVNLYVTTDDSGEIRIIAENEVLYRYLTIDAAPTGIPNRLLTYLHDNAVNLDSQGLSVTIGGLLPNKISSGFQEFLSSVQWKINDLQTLINDYIGEGTTLWSYIVTSVDSFFSLNIGGITLGAVFGTLIAISILIAYLKLFLGG